MSGKYGALIVVMESDIGQDEMADLVLAIKRFRGVLDVAAHTADVTTHIAEARARRKIGDAVWSAIYPEAGAQS